MGSGHGPGPPHRPYPVPDHPAAGLRLATPLVTNRAIAITKGTALGISVSLQETLGSAQSMMAILANPSPLTLAAAFYLLFFIPLVIFSRWVEWRAAREG
jgi:ABC-type amino acid transport system permease subunit